MNTHDKTFAEENGQVITNVVHHDADGEVISEDITCETSTRLPILRLLTDEDARNECFIENNRPCARA